MTAPPLPPERTAFHVLRALLAADAAVALLLALGSLPQGMRTALGDLVGLPLAWLYAWCAGLVPVVVLGLAVHAVLAGLRWRHWLAYGTAGAAMGAAPSLLVGLLGSGHWPQVLDIALVLAGLGLVAALTFWGVYRPTKTA